MSRTRLQISVRRTAWAVAVGTVVLTCHGPVEFAQDARAATIEADKVVYDARPNIVWVFAEDMGPELSCHGHPAVRTPVIDRFAEQGIRYTSAFTTAPSCSPARAAMATGVYQISIDAHHQRMHRDDGQMLPEPIQVFTKYLQQTGYYTALGCGFSGKTDYNFQTKLRPFDGNDWRHRQDGQPFFAQITLAVTHRHGNWEKNRAGRPDPVDLAEVELPPYYPDHPVCRLDWATYLDQIEIMDEQFGQILDRLDKEGLTDDTVVIFMGDNGRCHVRGKCWLYDPGLHVPLAIRWPNRIKPAAVCDDLISSIDVTATILRLAGVELPDYFDGHPILGPGRQRRDCIFAGRDRIDEAIERMRCVRTGRFKYIRNYWPRIPYTQPHEYIEANRPMLQVLVDLHAQGKLNEAQARFMAPEKPKEELYDLAADPHEVHNLADDPGHAGVLADLRRRVDTWVEKENDCGADPENPPAMGPKYRQATIDRYRQWGFEMPDYVEPEPRQPAAVVPPEVDAAGGVDGYKDGTWGFHTVREKDPWWQVDLGLSTALDRVVIFNRCDHNRGLRNVHITVWISDSTEGFRQVYRHDGTPFGGQPDGNPLTVPMQGQQARYVRLGLEETESFHLDEVEVYAVDNHRNVALGRPATQSSSGEWSTPPKRPLK